MYQTELELTRVIVGCGSGAFQTNELFDQKPDFSHLENFARRELTTALKLADIELREDRQRLRLRLALHLAPRDAIKYDNTRSVSRKQLVREHLISEFKITPQDADEICRDIATILDLWDSERSSSYRSGIDNFLKMQNYCCASCCVPLRSDQRIAEEERRALEGSDDPYKPYFDGDGVVSMLSPEVDHIIAISKDGTNSRSNLQVLCALCNRGKGDGLGVSLRQEWENATESIEKISRHHRFKMLYYRLEMDNFTCSKCGAKGNELTVRPLRTAAGYVLTNLRTVCYECLRTYSAQL